MKNELLDISKKQAILKAKESNFLIYKIISLRNKDNKGLLFTYAHKLNDTTVTTEQTREIWNTTLSDCIHQDFTKH